MKRISILVMLLILAITLSVQSQNILSSLNGDFEKGTIESWRFVEVGTSVAKSSASISTDACSGTYAAKVTWASNAAIQDLV